MEHPHSSLPKRRLTIDFFRGYALLIIFINHIPFNPLFYVTPSRFGFSDAAEIFVYLSGFVAAVAYSRTFSQVGLYLGVLRLLVRCWQIYTWHLASFIVLAAICVFGNQWVEGIDYIERLYIQHFFNDTQEAVKELVTLRYVPNFFDILPMYLVIMLWVPVVWLASRLHVKLALYIPVLLYVCSWTFGWELSANPQDTRPWFFNPFDWQLMFFTGFAIAAGWLKVPAFNRHLIALCAMLVVLAIPLSHDFIYTRIAWLGDIRACLEPVLDKSHLGLLRWIHFLATAYLVTHCCLRHGSWLAGRWAGMIALVGRQSLPMLLVSMSLSYLAGMLLDVVGRQAIHLLAVNLAGLALMLMIARMLAWLETQPWKPDVDAELPPSYVYFAKLR